jgi:hypothetical protein
MEWLNVILVLAFFSVPLLLSIAAVVYWRGLSRWIAMLPLVVLAGAYAVDAYSVFRGGNLAGLLTILASVPSLALLLLIWGVDAVHRWHSRNSRGLNRRS